MTPKIIHYCWFGHNPLPESAQKCIASWRKFFPDYEIWQWSEKELETSSNLDDNDNVNCLYDKLMGFDVNSIQYTREDDESAFLLLDFRKSEVSFASLLRLETTHLPICRHDIQYGA